MPQIDGEEYLARDDIAAVWTALDHADGAHGVRDVADHRLDALDPPSAAAPRVLAQRDGHRPGMRLLPGDGDVVPAQALGALHDSDHVAVVLQDRSLLDVQLEHAGKFARACLLGATVADALKLLAESFAVAIGA